MLKVFFRQSLKEYPRKFFATFVLFIFNSTKTINMMYYFSLVDRESILLWTEKIPFLIYSNVESKYRQKNKRKMIGIL